MRKMRTIGVVISVVLTVGLATSQYVPPIHVSADSCLEQALQRWYVPAATKFSQFAPFTLSMPSSRHLYEQLFAHNFTPQTFKEYCRNYHEGRREYERCSPSPQKATALAGYGLADYICIQRLEDFANAMPCLQSTILVTSTACAPQCSQFEHSSRMHLQPNVGVDSRSHMAGDCRYLKCLSDCRRPQVTARCGPAMANLIQEALQNTMISVRKQQESTHARVQYDAVGRPMFSTFPEECQALMAGTSSLPYYPLSDPQPIPRNPFQNPQPNPFPPSMTFPPYNPNPNPNPIADPNIYPYRETGGTRYWSGANSERGSVGMAMAFVCFYVSVRMFWVF